MPKVFTNSASPGWADPSGTFDDPRKAEDGAYPPLGTLPKTHAHYEGLYVHGDHTVLKFTIGGDVILEMPALEDGVITRTIQGTFSNPATVSLSTSETAVSASAGEVATTADGRLVLKIPAGPQHLKIAYSDSVPGGALTDLTTLTKGGPPGSPRR